MGDIPTAGVMPTPPAGLQFGSGGVAMDDGDAHDEAWPLVERRERVGVLGGGSFVALYLLPRLERAGYATWRVPRAAATTASLAPGPIRAVVALCPIWGLVERLPHLAEAGVRRLVAVSSTSRSSKAASPDPADRAVAARLAAAEEAIAVWAGAHGVRSVILRPTLVYDGVRDSNVTTIAGFVRRWGVFPLVGAGTGLRQPLHADDLAAACVAALAAPEPRPCYDVSGGETLTYREMIGRIFDTVGRRPRFVHVPRSAVRSLLPLAGWLPHWRGASLAALDRMNEPLVADHAAASRDLNFAPRAFLPSPGEPS
jgi:uncharacterized protein YbjT (DUF2867 family)